MDLAKNELQKITIDDEKLTQGSTPNSNPLNQVCLPMAHFLLSVMTMGFSSTEARLALRASFNDVDKAVEQIFKVSAGSD